MLRERNWLSLLDLLSRNFLFYFHTILGLLFRFAWIFNLLLTVPRTCTFDASTMASLTVFQASLFWLFYAAFTFLTWWSIFSNAFNKAPFSFDITTSLTVFQASLFRLFHTAFTSLAWWTFSAGAPLAVFMTKHFLWLLNTVTTSPTWRSISFNALNEAPFSLNGTLATWEARFSFAVATFCWRRSSSQRSLAYDFDMSSLMSLILLEFDDLSKKILINLIRRLIEIFKDRIKDRLLFLFYFLAQLIQYLIYI